MTKHEIISNLYESKPFNDYVNRMEPAHLRQDLKQESILLLLELPDDRVQSINASGGLLYYSFRVILNLVKNNRCRFHRLYLTPTTDAIPEIQYHELNGRVVREMKEDEALAKISGLYWYDREIVRLYLKLGSYAAIEKETRIPQKACCRTVTKAVKQIRDAIKL